MKHKTKVIVAVLLYLIWVIGTMVPVTFIDDEYILYHQGPDYSDYSFTILKVGLIIIPLFFGHSKTKVLHSNASMYGFYSFLSSYLDFTERFSSNFYVAAHSKLLKRSIASF
ncbi:hypothetical protein [Bacillus sp. MUM 13]|uniref:hypothetical protein n=1 Tax=Bacillus sp. MUM 13 TaxID=1678001 RepID=UPI0008F5E2BC|nr:hypothetical protein [Bacillus sp. MUM 13]OIK12218.1 hypothetical protein BIV59_09560 [Bacillus sp. MUM 13]